MKAILRKLMLDTRGATAVEYGLICAMIVLAMLAALKGVANETTNTWNSVTQKSQDAINASGS